MTHLYICRHSKSEPFDHEKADHQRELTDRGGKDAAAVGAEFAARGIHPDLILASDSTRTRQTTALISAALSADPRTEFLPELYSATAGEVLDVVAARAPGCESLLVVGHNPGLEDLVSRIAGREIRMRTSTVAVLETNSEAVSAGEPLSGLHLADVFGPREK